VVQELRPAFFLLYAYWGKIFSRTYFYKKEPILMIGSFFMQNNFA
jgi:hypothetical protein